MKLLNTKIIIIVLLLGIFLFISCGEKPISPSHPPVTYNKKEGIVTIPNATIITAGQEYKETAPLSDSGLALVITQDSSLYFYAAKLGNCDSITIDASCKALGYFFRQIMPPTPQNLQEFDTTLETGITLRKIGTAEVECANKLHRWGVVKVAPSNNQVLLPPRQLFKLDIISLFEGDWSNIFSFNRVPKDTISLGNKFYTFGAISRLFLVSEGIIFYELYGPAIKNAFYRDPTAFTCLQILDGLDLIFFVVDVVWPTGKVPLKEVVGRTLFKEAVKIAMQGAMADIVAEGSSKRIVTESQRQIIPTIVENIILNCDVAGSNTERKQSDTTIMANIADSDSGVTTLALPPILLAILQAIKIIAASAEQVTGIYDEATHLPYATYTYTHYNWPPNIPTPPSGPDSGNVNNSYTFLSSANDPDGDNIAIRFDWGDGTISNWSSYVSSGSTIYMAKSWLSPGTYYVKAQAKDIFNNISNWSDGHLIVISCLYTISLTWNKDPGDLDAHLWTPVIEGDSYHVYYRWHGFLHVAPYCSLDVDSVSGYGPEQITINRAFPGQYIYAVHHFAGDSTISTSGATVRIYRYGNLMRTLNVPRTPANPKWWWHVFKLNAVTGEITVLNVIAPDPPLPWTIDQQK